MDIGTPLVRSLDEKQITGRSFVSQRTHHIYLLLLVPHSFLIARKCARTRAAGVPYRSREINCGFRKIIHTCVIMYWIHVVFIKHILSLANLKLSFFFHSNTRYFHKIPAITGGRTIAHQLRARIYVIRTTTIVK